MNESFGIKLSELTKKVADVISKTFSDYYWIIAEISGHKLYTSQDRHYFEFIEKEEGKTEPIAKVRGVSWKEGSQHIKLFEQVTGQKFTNGIQVLVKVRVEFHASFGFQLALLDIDQSFTLGNLEKQRRDTLSKLILDNPNHVKKVGDEYLTFNRQLHLKPIIQHIAVIGSPNSEGYIDFMHTIDHNQFGYKFSIDIYQSAVQGQGAENELVSRLIAIFNSNIKYDAVVIIRGGGAKTDFVVFDTYPLARAVARFPLPIITGIGHHKDISIVDMMTHTMTKTPTKAAEFIISHNRKFEDGVIQIQKNIIIKTQQLLSKSKQNINASNVIIINKSRLFISDYKDNLNNFNQIIINKTKSILYNRKNNLINLLIQLSSTPKIVTGNKLNDLNNIINNLKLFSNKFIINQRGYIGHYEKIVSIMRPENILKKGFAIVSQKGKILKDVEDVNPGSDLTISTNNYEINTKVITKTKKNG